MKAAIVRKAGELLIEELPVPEPGQEEALVKVYYGGICGTDNHVYRGSHKTAKYPVVLGHEFVGRLEKINTIKDIDVKEGDNVLVQPYKPCGICEPCIQGSDNVCTKLQILGVHEHGCFAEYIKVPAHKVFKLPDNIDLKQAILVEPLAVAVHCVRKSEMQVGQTVFVIGGGPIGMIIAIVARLNGASEVVISEPNEYRKEFARKLGFNVIDPKNTDAVEEVKTMTKGRGFDVVFEASGSLGGAAMMTGCTKTSGTIVIVGVPSDKYPIDSGLILAKELKVVGVRIHAQINFLTAIKIMESGVLKDQLAPFIDTEFDLGQLDEAMKFSLEDQKHFKILINILK